MPANGPANGAGSDATPAGTSTGTVPEVGVGLCRPFKPPTMRTGNRYVIVARDYYTRVEYYQDDVVYV